MRLDVDSAELRRPGDPGTLSPAADGDRSRQTAPRTGRRGDFGATPGPSAAAGAGPAAAAGAGRGRGAPRGIPSSLDLRGARVDEALEALDRYLDAAAHASAGRVTIIHGHGSGAMRDAVRDVLSGHPLVREWRPGERGEGGDGATVVMF
jgi:DNA mismatch repair protein MutS2